MMANLKLNELFRRILPNTRREQVRQDAPSSQTLTRALAPVLAFWVQYRGQILGWLKPFWNYYQMRTRREQILLATGAVAFGLWMIYTLILTPYIEMRRGVQTAYDQAYAEYLWLESQIPRLEELLQRRGVRRALIGDATRFVTERLGDAQVSVTDDGLYRITWAGDEGGPFFSVINALIDYGAALESIQFRRAAPQQRRSTFVAIIRY